MTSELPHQLLKEIHLIDFDSLYSSQFSTKKERVEHIKLARQKLREVKRLMTNEIKDIKAKWDGRNSYEANQERLHLAQFEPLENLISQLEIFLKEYEIKGSDAPPPSKFGTEYTGDFDDAEWFIFTELEAWKWLSERIKSSAKNIRKRQISIKEEGDELKQIANKNLNTRDLIIKNIIPVGISILIISVVLYMFIIIGIDLASLLGLVMLALAIPFVIMISIFQTISSHKNRKEEAATKLLLLKKENDDLNRILAELKTQHKTASGNIALLS